MPNLELLRKLKENQEFNVINVMMFFIYGLVVGLP
jgi:hypothetical protein